MNLHIEWNKTLIIAYQSISKLEHLSLFSNMFNQISIMI